MSQKWSVKSLVAYLKLKLDNDFLIQNINVVGEISNFNYHNNRHMYFTLKDESSRISCVMFASSASRVKFMPKDGMKVNLTASVSIFESSGSLQLYVTDMQEDGIGDLALKFEALKKKLNEEGLFKEEYKKTFKRYPQSIAIISGKDSAALNDILTTLERRWPMASVNVYTSLVQGNTAHLDIIDKLLIADKANHDAIILARGGGSIEDLWAFNEEDLARVIFALKTPIVSGVGHEIDFTISDFVSDLRAPTPTAAAELITPNIVDVKVSFNNLKNTFIDKMQYKVNNSNQLLYTYASKPIYLHPELLVNKYTKLLDTYNSTLLNYKDKQLREIKHFKDLSNNLMSKLNKTITNEKIKVNNLNNELNNNINKYQESIRNKFASQLNLLDSYSPINTLKRGYSLVSMDNKVISKIDDINIESTIEIKMQDGSLKAKVLEKEIDYE